MCLCVRERGRNLYFLAILLLSSPFNSIFYHLKYRILIVPIRVGYRISHIVLLLVVSGVSTTADGGAKRGEDQHRGEAGVR